MAEVIDMALAQSPQTRQAQTTRETSYWEYRRFRAGLNPQFRLSGAAPSYSQRFLDVRQPDGQILFRPINQFNPEVTLGLEQPIWITGGTLSANTSLNYFNNVENRSTLWNGTLLNVRLSQPLFVFNPQRWDRRIMPLIYEESKRAYAEQEEFISREAVNRFFNVLQAQTNLQIATFNLANNDTVYKIEQGRYNIGTTSRDNLLQIELQLLRSRQDVAQANLDLQTARLQFRNYLGLKDTESFSLELPDTLPVFEINEQEALDYAMRNRADYIAFERRRLEADRAVASAKGQRHQTTLNAAYGLNNSGPLAEELYLNPQRQQVFNVSFNVPFLNWGRNKALMKTAEARKQLNDYIIAQEVVNFEQELITLVRQFEIVRLQIQITSKSDEVATERYNVVQNRYLIGKVDITNLNIALTEKDAARRAYLQALNSFWIAYYDLRRLTLYDFHTRRLLYETE
jgi:outer membrane protein TolC